MLSTPLFRLPIFLLPVLSTLPLTLRRHGTPFVFGSTLYLDAALLVGFRPSFSSLSYCYFRRTPPVAFLSFPSTLACLSPLYIRFLLLPYDFYIHDLSILFVHIILCPLLSTSMQHQFHIHTVYVVSPPESESQILPAFPVLKPAKSSPLRCDHHRTNLITRRVQTGCSEANQGATAAVLTTHRQATIFLLYLLAVNM